MISKKLKLIAYVGGPITHAISAGNLDSEYRIKLQKIFNLIERSGMHVLSAYLEEEFGKNLSTNPIHIYNRDKSFIKRANICIFFLPSFKEGELLRTDGTFCCQR